MNRRRPSTLMSWLMLTLACSVMTFYFVACESAYYHSANVSRHMAVPEASKSDATASQAPHASAPVDEIWVIAKPEGVEPVHTSSRPVADQDPMAELGTGAMVTQKPGSETFVPMPLKNTRVQARIDAFIATVDVQQQFQNPYDSKIEAVYVFPLPQNAAVNEFIMTIGDRRIRGIIRERKEAEELYKQARSQGYVASLLTQERPNIFTQKVANIEPGKRIDVNIKYFNTLTYDDGWYEFVFPMVVGPRYNPPGSTNGIGAVGRGQHGLSGQTTEVQYLKPGERSGHDISLSLEIDAGVTIESIRSVNHQIQQTQLDDTRVRVNIDERDSLPNKDFVLRYQVAGERIKTQVLTHRDERGGFFTLVLYPPKNLQSLERSPMEMIFVLDCSGSMSGKPISQAKDAILHALDKLEPYDTFQVIRFSNNASQFGDKPLPATSQAIHQAKQYVSSLHGSGGTQMIEGIKAALDFPHETGRLRFVSFMTDGYIGNEREIIREVHNRIGDSRIFSFGVGSSPNRYLMNRMAREGRGVAAYLSLNDDGDQVMNRFFSRVSHPALTDIEINFGNANVSEVYPHTVPDLFVGRPVIITGRYNGNFNQDIQVTGRVAGQNMNIRIPIDPMSTANRPAIASIWARTKIADLYDQSTWDQDGLLAKTIERTALDYQLMSPYTAFVAVDSATRTQGSHGTTVSVAVPVPDGVRYQTTVTE